MRYYVSTLVLCVSLVVETTGYSQPLFEDVLPGAGIDHFGSSYGIAWRDYNDDGAPDVWLSNHAAPSTLYKNNGDGTFTLAFVAPAPTDTHGVGWADFDDDGDADLLELSGAGRGNGPGEPNRLFVNDNGNFTQRASEHGLSYPLGRGRFPLWFDYDHDGFLDVLLSNNARTDGRAPTAFFANTAGTFLDVTADLGLEFNRTGHYSGALLADLTSDRKLDLILVRMGGAPRQRVYRLDRQPLERTSLPLVRAAHMGYIVGAVTKDLNGDLRPDFLAVQSVERSDIKRRSRNNIFVVLSSQASGPVSSDEPVGVDIHASGTISFVLERLAPLSTADIFIGARGTHPASTIIRLDSNDPNAVGTALGNGAARGIYIGRVNQRWSVRAVGAFGLLNMDIAVDSEITEYEPFGFELSDELCHQEPNCRARLLLSNSAGGYRNATAASGLYHGVRCHSVATADFDNDMDVDVFQACSNPAGNLPNVLLLNQGNGVFSRVLGHGAEGTMSGHSDRAATADYDGDGFLDIYVTNGLLRFRGPDQLFRNLGNRNNWLKLDLHGLASNRDAVGARVEITTGGVSQLREQNGGLHFGVQDDRILHFGLGTNTVVDHIVVYWPSGQVQQLFDIPANQLVTIEEDDQIPDEDNDGLPDVWEYEHALAPLDSVDADEDPDRDGLDNLTEFSVGTNPRNADTDGDGLEDSVDPDPTNAHTSDDIRNIDAPLRVVPGATVSISIDVALAGERDVLLALSAVDNSWWGGRVIETVQMSGARTLTVAFAVPQNTPTGNELRWVSRILPPGAGWMDSLARKEQRGVFTQDAPDDTILFVDAPTSVPAVGEVDIKVSATLAEARDIIVALKSHDDTWWGGRIVLQGVFPRENPIRVTFPLRREPPIDTDLRWVVRIVPTGMDWQDTLAKWEMRGVRAL